MCMLGLAGMAGVMSSLSNVCIILTEVRIFGVMTC